MTEHKHTPPHLQTAMQELRQTFVTKDIDQMKKIISRLTPAEGIFLGFTLGMSITSDDSTNAMVIGLMFAHIMMDGLTTGAAQ